MQCPLCGHPKSHKHGQTSKGSQRYRCPHCQQTFSETFDTLYYRRQISPATIQAILQSHAEGSSLRGLSRITGVAYIALQKRVKTLIEQNTINAKLEV